MAKELIGKIKSVTIDAMVGEFEGGKTPFKTGLNVNTQPEKLITYERKGRKVICTIEIGDLKVRGVARCHEEDIFDLAEGCGLAELRAKVKFYQELETRYIEHITRNPMAQIMKAMGQWNE
jgi:hypothetical protein